MKHRIRRQVLELDLPRAEGARAMAEEASRLFQEKVLPQLDTLFTQLAPPDKYIRIDRLEIDLRQIPEKDFARHFVETCVEQLTRQISQLVVEVEKDAQSNDQVRILSEPAQLIEMLGAFLRSGTLPWRARSIALPTLEEKLQRVLQERPGRLVEKIRAWVQVNPASMKRLIWQFSPTFVDEVVARLLDLNPPRFVRLLRQLETQLIRNWTPLQRQQILIALALAPPSAKLPTSEAWEQAVEWWYTSAAWFAVAPLLKPTALSPDIRKKLKLELVDTEQAFTLQTDRKEQPQQRSNRVSRSAQAEGEPLTLAGLVLLTPYISSFFNNLNIQPQPEQPESAFRAVHLLYHLATGQEQAEEPDLHLPKLLCGLAVDEPVPQQVFLTDTEKAESENLLRAVINNWPVLKSTSPDGLRSAFLQRNGLVYRKIDSDDLRLVVERKSQDLLLERLPWGFSVVKFSWADYLINVEW